MTIDLNADVGESFGVYSIGADDALFESITSANIACGYHAGDPSVMRRTVRAARQRGIAIGAHPGFPDLVGFGRRELDATAEEVEDFVLYQVGALAAIAAAEGVPLQHVKPHGALFNMAVRRPPLAAAIARAVAAVDRSLILFGLPDSALLRAGREQGLRVAAEAFADRAYERDGSLVPRRVPGAVIDDPDIVVTRAVRLARDRSVTAVDGTVLRLEVETICVHGDTPGAGALAARVRSGLQTAGIDVRAIGARFRHDR